MKSSLAALSLFLLSAAGAGCGPAECTSQCADGTACSTGDTCASYYCSPAGTCGPLDCSTVATATYSDIDTNVFAKSCAHFSVCHLASSHKGNLDLETDAYAALVGVTPDNAAAKAAGMKRVDPGKEDNSFLVKKLTMPTSSDMWGQTMPFEQRLDAAHISEIRCWVRAGAPKN